MEDNRPKYPVKCPNCSKEFYAYKSIAQEMGLNDCGMGACTECETMLRLIFNPEEQRMDTEILENRGMRRNGEQNL